MPAEGDFGSLLKRSRVQASLSQQALADRALMSVQAISALERGSRKVPYPATVERIVGALDLPQEQRRELERSAQRAREARLQELAANRLYNLPRELTPLFGRDAVLSEVSQLIETSPVVTIAGAGGVGKTRLAIAVGNATIDVFPHGVWFVGLGPVTDSARVPHALAEALRLNESANRSIEETIRGYLQRKRLLVILDNCEHVISGARDLGDWLVSERFDVALLVTSREPLGIAGERVYQLPTLDVPPDPSCTPDEALAYGAVELFVDRAQVASRQFALTDSNVDSVCRICRRLDGLPLAMELAAARVTVLTPRQICDELERNFDVLWSRDQKMAPRHQTIKTLIDWSYTLLSPPARALFERLAIFVGGCTLHTAMHVCDDDAVPSGHVLELLATLVSQSLLRVDFDRSDARYTFLETTRRYALDRLTERGDLQALAHRHAREFTRLAQRLDVDWYAPNERHWHSQAEDELPNWRAALDWALTAQHDIPLGCTLAAAMARVWYSTTPVEGRRWVRLALRAADACGDPSLTAALFIAEGELSAALGEYAAALSSAERALELRDRLDALQIARAQQTAGSALGALGRASEGERVLQEALVSSRRLDNARMQALVLGDLGTVRSRGGDVVGARQYYAETLMQYRALKLERPAASVAGHLAEVQFANGDVTTALEYAQEARVGHEVTNNRRGVANDLCNVAAYLVALDDFVAARDCARRALIATRDLQLTVHTAFALQHAAAVAALEDATEARSRAEAAANVFGFVDARLEALRAEREFTEQQEYERVGVALRERLGAHYESAIAAGRAWNEDDAVAAAMTL